MSTDKHPIVCEHCILHHQCKRLCVMSPQHISAGKARERLENAKKMMQEARDNKNLPKEQEEYLGKILKRGEERCEKAEEIFKIKYGKYEP